MVDKDLDQAKNMLNEAISLFEDSQNHYILLDVYKFMSDLQLKKSNPQSAQTFLDQTKLHVDKSRQDNQNIVLKIAQTRILAAHGKYSAAYQMLIETMYKKQKPMTDQSTRQLHEPRTQFDLESQEKTNSKLAQENAEQKNAAIERGTIKPVSFDFFSHSDFRCFGIDFFHHTK